MIVFVAHEKELVQVLERIEQLKAVQLYQSKRKLYLHYFIGGIVQALGAIFGATIVMSLIVYTLSQVSWVPIIGGFVTQVMNQLPQ
jgi:hypothetical protein